MSTTFKNTMREVMSLAWQFVRKNGYTLSEALKCAWVNIKLKAALSKRVVKFYFQKVDGSLREAYGTLMSDRIPTTKGEKRQQTLVKCTLTLKKTSGVVSRKQT